MKHERATLLLERYFEGKTSLQEEQALRDYFRQENVADHLTGYAPLFQYWDREAAIMAPPRRQTRRRRMLLRTLMAVAAALLFVLVAREVSHLQNPALNDFPVANRTAVDWSRHEITNEKEALLFLRNVLKTTSRQVTQGPVITLRELREVEKIMH